jgi:D-mannose binding lectin.
MSNSKCKPPPTAAKTAGETSYQKGSQTMKVTTHIFWEKLATRFMAVLMSVVMVTSLVPVAKAASWSVQEKVAIASIFDYDYYKSNYADLQKAFGNNTGAYFEHLLNHGISEKRSFSRVYNHNDYHNTYVDLQNAFKGDPVKLLKHFISNGMNEQRVASKTFNVKIYADNYVDLTATFQGDWKSYFAHYTSNGYKEGRNATTKINQPVPVAQGDTLPAGATLTANQFIRSQNGEYTAVMQSDNNFVVYHGATVATNALYSTATVGSGGTKFTLQKDGNIVLYDASGNAKWSPNIHGKGAVKLVIQNDANLVAYTETGTPVWASAIVVGKTDTMFVGQTFRNDQALTSANKRYTAVMQSDGNLVIYEYGTAIWSSKTNGNSKAYFAFQSDGNLVVYDQAGKAKWSPNIHGKGATRLVMQSDGNLVAYGINNKAIWASNTARKDNLDMITVHWWGISVYIPNEAFSEADGEAWSYAIGEVGDSYIPGLGTIIGLAVEHIGFATLRAIAQGRGFKIDVTWIGLVIGISAQ